MTTYFDTAADAGLLPPAIRTSVDLANVAAECEKDVIEQYSDRANYWWYTARWGASRIEGRTGELVNASLNIYVYLLGYKKDSADSAVDPDLKDALKREIAGVIAWRFAQRDVNVLLTAESDGTGKHVSLRHDSAASFPPGFGRRLRRFDIREPCWGS